MKPSTIILSTLAVVFALGFAGCKKKESPAAPAKETTMKDVQMQAAKPAEDINKAATTAAAASIEQTTCPVMEGNKINKNVFSEYKGKKVYFCCEDCKAKFLAEPEKYVAKLPQFQK
ncbi:MAG: YHS domain-containing protein [Sedimentisphaerales bacterium]